MENIFFISLGQYTNSDQIAYHLGNESGHPLPGMMANNIETIKVGETQLLGLSEKHLYPSDVVVFGITKEQFSNLIEVESQFEDEEEFLKYAVGYLGADSVLSYFPKLNYTNSAAQLVAELVVNLELPTPSQIKKMATIFFNQNKSVKTGIETGCFFDAPYKHLRKNGVGNFLTLLSMNTRACSKVYLDFFNSIADFNPSSIIELNSFATRKVFNAYMVAAETLKMLGGSTSSNFNQLRT